MATVRVTLPHYGRSWDLSRQKILKIIPESLIGQALQLEPEVPEITFENPDVTPEAMQVIADYLDGREPEHHIPNLESSARYLNLPWLVIYSDPLYDQIQAGGNQELLVEAARTGHNLILNYLLSREIFRGDDLRLALHATIDADNLEGAQIILASPQAANISVEEEIRNSFNSRRYPYSGIRTLAYLIDRYSPDKRIAYLNAAIRLHDLPLVQYLYPHISLEEQKGLLENYDIYGFIDSAIQEGAVSIAKWLLTQPHIEDISDLLVEAIQAKKSSLSLIEMLIQRIPQDAITEGMIDTLNLISQRRPSIRHLLQRYRLI